MYGLVALGYHITWSTSRTMNFSQGHAVMAGAVVAYAVFVALGWPFPLALLVQLFYHRTPYGKQLKAVAWNPEAAGLMGINIPRAVMASYALSAVLAGVAGVLLAPVLNVSPQMGTIIGLKAFAVAIIGGLTSAPGIIVAGLGYGLVESFTAGYVSTRARE